MEFAVAAAHEIPQDLAQIITEKQQSPFKLTYSDNDNLYIVPYIVYAESGKKLCSCAVGKHSYAVAVFAPLQSRNHCAVYVG